MHGPVVLCCDRPRQEPRRPWARVIRPESGLAGLWLAGELSEDPLRRNANVKSCFFLSPSHLYFKL